MNARWAIFLPFRISCSVILDFSLRSRVFVGDASQPTVKVYIERKNSGRKYSGFEGT